MKISILSARVSLPASTPETLTQFRQYQPEPIVQPCSACTDWACWRALTASFIADTDSLAKCMPVYVCLWAALLLVDISPTDTRKD